MMGERLPQAVITDDQAQGLLLAYLAWVHAVAWPDVGPLLDLAKACGFDMDQRWLQRWIREQLANYRNAQTLWVKSWDGWPYCPGCAAKIRLNGFRLDDWPSDPVEVGAGCTDCRVVLAA